MKKYLIIVITCFTITSIGLSKNSLKTYKAEPVFSKLLENEGIESYKIPTFLVRYALSFSDTREIISLLQGTRSIKFATSNNGDKDNNLIYNRICNNLDLSSYQNLISVVDAKSKITIKALFDKEYIREVVIIIYDEDALTAISMTGKINPKNIIESINKLNKPKPDNN